MLYKEEQKFNSLWIYLILCIVAVLLLQGIKSGYQFDLWHILLVFTPILFIIYLVEFSRLFTTISKEGISYRFKPFHKTQRHISWSEIKFIKTDIYRPIRRFWWLGCKKRKEWSWIQYKR